jgi:hypothetical protein
MVSDTSWLHDRRAATSRQRAAPSTRHRPSGRGHAVVEGGSIAVSATGSDPDGDPITYAWDLDGDGTFETAGQTATFSAVGIAAPASLTIRVRGSDPGGLSDADAATVAVTWPNGGFGPPIGGGSGPVTAKAGSVIPVKFSLGGDRGPNPLRVGYPASGAFTCGTALPPDASEPADSVGKGGLRYDSSTDTYSFQWKTDKSWKDVPAIRRQAEGHEPDGQVPVQVGETGRLRPTRRR